jgi:citronellol/citronellal dehydrogenase
VRLAPDPLSRSRVVLVSGSGTGLGKAAAIELARCAARVVIAARRQEVLDDALSEIGPNGWAVAGDVREPTDTERVVRAALEHGRLDVLVNQAATHFTAPPPRDRHWDGHERNPRV